MSETQAAAIHDINVGSSIQVIRYARINTLLTRNPKDWSFFQEGALGFAPESTEELPNDHDPGMPMHLVYGRPEVAELDPDVVGIAARLTRAGEALHTGRYCRVLLRAATGELADVRVRQLLGRFEASVCAPIMTYGAMREYPVAPAGVKGPIVNKAAEFAARLLEGLERLGLDWTRTGEEVRSGLDVPAVCIESIPAGFRQVRELSVSGIGIEARL